MPDRRKLRKEPVEKLHREGWSTPSSQAADDAAMILSIVIVVVLVIYFAFFYGPS